MPNFLHKELLGAPATGVSIAGSKALLQLPCLARTYGVQFPTNEIVFLNSNGYDSTRGTRPSQLLGGPKMTLRLGDIAPDFTADTTDGTINFHEFLGDGWGVLFSHPKDFTPVCTTELGMVSKLKPEFEKRDTKVVGLSVDPIESHQAWTDDIEETQGHALNFPLIADPDRTVSDLYDMIHPNANDTLTVRSVFIISPQKQVKLIITYPASTGRNFDEILRVIDSLQLTANYSVATPVNWVDGEDVIIVPALSDEDAKTKFPKGWKALKPYLRVTPQPNK